MLIMYCHLAVSCNLKRKNFFLRLFKFSPPLRIENLGILAHLKKINFKRFSINSAIDFNFCILIFLFIIALFLFYFKRLIENRLLGSLVLLSLPMQKAQVRLLTEAIYFCVFYYLLSRCWLKFHGFCWFSNFSQSFMTKCQNKKCYYNCHTCFKKVILE